MTDAEPDTRTRLSIQHMEDWPETVSVTALTVLTRPSIDAINLVAAACHEAHLSLASMHEDATKPDGNLITARFARPMSRAQILRLAAACVDIPVFVRFAAAEMSFTGPGGRHEPVRLALSNDPQQS